MIATSPWFWLALLIMAMVIFGKGYDTGARHARNHAAAEQLIAVQEARLDAIKQAKADQQTAKDYEKAREKVRTVYVNIKEKAHENIENNVGYAECGLDPDGLQLYNAHPGRAQNPTGSPDSRVSGSPASERWQALDDPDEQPGAVATVLRLSSAPQRIIGMDEQTVGADDIRPKTE